VARRKGFGHFVFVDEKLSHQQAYLARRCVMYRVGLFLSFALHLFSREAYCALANFDRF
jgi:hypothetical protein